MEEKVSLIVMPTLLTNPGDTALLRFFVDQRGMWRDTPLISGGPAVSLDYIHKRIDSQLRQLMKHVGAPKDKPELTFEFFLRKACGWLYDSVIPLHIQSVLQKVASTATGDDVPGLYIHVHSSFDWIPWEIMHDGTDFLGLRFKIARLPIVPTPPDLSNCHPHPVRRIYNLLGEGVLSFKSPSHDQLFKAWGATFNGLVPDTVEKYCFPDPKSVSRIWPVLDKVAEAEATDILHITCHGGLIDKDGKVYWSLKDQSSDVLMHKIDSDFVKSLNKLALSKPLVFGNTCASSNPGEDGDLNPGLGTVFFSQGALNVVGTVAPISMNMALDFAPRFYQRLLGKDGEPGLPIGQALWATKKHYRDQGEQGGIGTSIGKDPSFLFYCLYGPPDICFQAAQ